MAKSVRYIFMQEYKPTVIDSQVFSWLDTTRSIFDLNVIVSVVPPSKKKLDKKIIDGIGNKHRIRFHQISLPSIIAIRELTLLFLVLKIYLLHIGASSLVLQSRFMVFSLISPIICRFPKLKLIYEARGTAIIEYLYIENKAKADARKAWFISLCESTTLKYSDLIIAVSQKQKEFFANEYGTKVADKTLIIPGAADAQKFFNNVELRATIRKKMGIDGKTVFLYSGRLDKPWQIPQEAFRTFKHISTHIHNSFFIILTPDQVIANNLFSQHEIPSSSFLISYANLTEINSYLNAADYGILFREDLPINNHSSPTKFAEYILAGLKVIISEGIGDYSEFVLAHDCGQVVRLISGIFDVNTQMLTQYSSDERERISKIGYELLSTQVFTTKLREAFSSLK